MANKIKDKTRPASRAARKSTPGARRATTPLLDAPNKPIFRVGTWLAVVILAILVGFAYFLKTRKETPNLETIATSDIAYIFTANDGAPSEIEIIPAEDNAQRVKVRRGTDGLWKLILPFETEANQGSAQAAADQAARLRMLGEINLAPEDLGLDKPTHVINISFTGGKSHKLEIGSVTITNSGYYTRVDEDRIVMLDKDEIDALLNLQASPPYLATPTPSPLPPTPTPTPSPLPLTGTPAPVLESAPPPTP